MILTIQQFQQDLPNIIIPGTIKECKQQCKTVQNLIQTLECNAVQLQIDEQ